MLIDTVLLKVASRCNLNCSYCYIYHLGDDAWKRQPKRMSDDIVLQTCAQLAELARLQGKPFSVVLHGGEPLLIGAEGFGRLAQALRDALPAECGLHLQTNGILINEEIVDLCVRHRIGVSISLDGPASLHDRFRFDHAGRGSHASVLRGIARLRDRDDARGLFSGVLCVVDPRSDPGEVYSFLKSTGAPSLDFLYRDGNHAELPFGKAAIDSVEYGGWMCRLLEVYLADSSPPRVRVLDDLIRLIMGGRGVKEGIGTDSYGILIIDTDGTITKNDTLKSAGAAQDQFKNNWSVTSGSLSDLLVSEEFSSYFTSQSPTAAECQNCPDLQVCGGGMPTHRWSVENSFNNPSVYCADQKLLIGRIRSKLASYRGAA